MNDDEVARRFRPQDLSEYQLSKIEEFRKEFEELARKIAEQIPCSRESSLALTALEDSSFWAVKAVSRWGCQPVT